jgi:hypothetical protein
MQYVEVKKSSKNKVKKWHFRLMSSTCDHKVNLSQWAQKEGKHYTPLNKFYLKHTYGVFYDFMHCTICVHHNQNLFCLKQKWVDKALVGSVETESEFIGG